MTTTSNPSRAGRTGRCLLVAAFVLTSSACTGGSSNGGGGDALPGTILVDDGASTLSSGALYAIDPNSGAARRYALPLPDESDDTVYTSSARFEVGGAGYADTLMLGVNFCLPDDSACVERVDPDGSVERLFTVPWVARAPTLSPDGTLVAVLTSTGLTDGPYALRLLTPTGDAVASQAIASDFVEGPFAGYDWAPGNRLVYSFRREGEGTFLLLSQSGSLTPEAVWQVSPDGSESVGTISVSPDGRFIAYDKLADGVDEAGRDAYVLDVTTGESTLLAVDGADRPKSRLGDPEWSPDGRYVLVTYGQSATGGSVVGSALPFVMVVEWAGETVTLDPYGGVGRVLVTDRGGIDSGGVGPREEWTFGRAFWTS